MEVKFFLALGHLGDDALDFAQEFMLDVFGLQRPRQGVVFDQLHESRILKCPVFLLVVHEDGLCHQAHGAVLAYGVWMLFCKRAPLLCDPCTRSRGGCVHRDVEFKVEAVGLDVGQDARQALVLDALLVLVRIVLFDGDRHCDAQ